MHSKAWYKNKSYLVHLKWESCYKNYTNCFLVVEQVVPFISAVLVVSKSDEVIGIAVDVVVMFS